MEVNSINDCAIMEHFFVYFGTFFEPLISSRKQEQFLQHFIRLSRGHGKHWHHSRFKKSSRHSGHFLVPVAL